MTTQSVSDNSIKQLNLAIAHINSVVETLRLNDSRDVSPEQVQLALAKEVIALREQIAKHQENETFKKSNW